jgi:hypothetical protein
MSEKGLRERILAASSSGAIDQLLTEGEVFLYAAKRTRSSWKHAAARRRKELSQPKPKPKPPKAEADPKKRKRPKKDAKK